MQRLACMRSTACMMLKIPRSMSSNFFKQNIIETELKYIRLLNHK